MTITVPAQARERVPVLEAVGVSRHFDVSRGFGRHQVVRAVEQAHLTLHRGEIVALVSESGSGKTTLARLLALFHGVTAGEIRLNGTAVHPKSKAARAYHSAVQMIFQDPFGSLNPQRRVRHNLERALRLHGHAAASKRERRLQVLELLEKVNLTPAEQFIDKLPHELSDGRRQRVVIARALAVRPSVLIGDEPISTLDVSIRLDMLNLLARLRDEEGLSLLYITHDIASARYLADRIHVMYAGQIVESGPTEEVIQHPKHPYTKLLLDSSPDTDQLVVDITGADPATTRTAQLHLWQPRTPTASASSTSGMLSQTWKDNTQPGGSGNTFGALAALTTDGQHVQASVVNPLTAHVSFCPDPDGSSPQLRNGSADTPPEQPHGLLAQSDRVPARQQQSATQQAVLLDFQTVDGPVCKAEQERPLALAGGQAEAGLSDSRLRGPGPLACGNLRQVLPAEEGFEEHRRFDRQSLPLCTRLMEPQLHTTELAVLSGKCGVALCQATWTSAAAVWTFRVRWAAAPRAGTTAHFSSLTEYAYSTHTDSPRGRVGITLHPAPCRDDRAACDA
ncbi:ABC transporter ATP-binding protein [Streptomyces sp. NPDC051644]|uniref:ABC transporter ATP-binding protein n=1 Tax=Streptomyces sp. NPDC051644 TaxID=3365666 RepID=UPI0037A398D2